jgi:hypothetical protein
MEPTVEQLYDELRNKPKYMYMNNTEIKNQIKNKYDLNRVRRMTYNMN